VSQKTQTCLFTSSRKPPTGALRSSAIQRSTATSAFFVSSLLRPPAIGSRDPPFVHGSPPPASMSKSVSNLSSASSGITFCHEDDADELFFAIPHRYPRLLDESSLERE
jgi:hypothetical protein